MLLPLACLLLQSLGHCLLRLDNLSRQSFLPIPTGFFQVLYLRPMLFLCLLELLLDHEVLLFDLVQVLLELFAGGFLLLLCVR